MAKFNEEICKEICDLHSEGLPQKSCADLVGINRRTLYDWIQKGKNAKSGKYKQFYQNWLRASAKYEREHLGEISGSNSWLAHQYLLQVKDPETYVVAEKQQIEAETKTTLEANVDMNDPRIREDDLALLKALIDDKHGD
jgi:hypothetical protein